MGAGAIPLQIEKAFKQRAASRHKLLVYTAGNGYAGDDRVDVSVRGGYAVLTPPVSLLFDYRQGALSESRFQEAYFRYLEDSFVHYRQTWDTLLDSARIVFVCSCNADDKTCHRYYLIKFFKKFGAVYKGKLAS